MGATKENTIHFKQRKRDQDPARIQAVVDCEAPEMERFIEGISDEMLRTDVVPRIVEKELGKRRKNSYILALVRKKVLKHINESGEKTPTDMN